MPGWACTQAASEDAWRVLPADLSQMHVESSAKETGRHHRGGCVGRTLSFRKFGMLENSEAMCKQVVADEWRAQHAKGGRPVQLETARQYCNT